jgi:hypothetical protein
MRYKNTLQSLHLYLTLTESSNMYHKVTLLDFHLKMHGLILARTPTTQTKSAFKVLMMETIKTSSLTEIYQLFIGMCCTSHSSMMHMRAEQSSKILVYFYRTTKCHMTVDINLYLHWALPDYV